MANKRSIRSLAKVLAVTMGAITVATPLMACGGDKGNKLSNETSPLVLATDVLDGVFNPFFYTSGTDGEIVSQTQIGMLSSDRTGALVANWDEPCVALDYSVVTTGTLSDIDRSKVGDAQYENFYTDYYFALKDDIVFSDGTALTKDDVLFNIYMYLDPAYNGSNTMYSVNIKGLSAYRAQSLDASNAAASNTYYSSIATARINRIYDWIDSNDGFDDLSSYEYYDDIDIIESDIAKVHELFKEELQDDWNSAMAIEDVAKDYDRYVDRDGKPIITENWQAFLYNYGIITPVRKLTSDDKPYYILSNTYCGFDENNQTEHRDCNGNHSAEALQNFVYASFFGDYGNDTTIKTYKEKLYNVITYYATATEFSDYVRSDVIEREIAKLGGLQVKTVSGVEVLENQSSIKYRDSNGQIQYRKLLDKEENEASYDVLHITINGLDPKAIQNFAFTVAPGHYYSSTWNKVKTGYGNEEDDPYFGVEFSSTTFMNGVRQNHLPMGAGPYVASKSNGGTTSDVSEFFESNTVVYFERNDKFMLGAPKIKKLRYRVVNSNALYNSIKSGEVHYGSPSMDIKVLNQLNGSDSNVLNSASADNLGYGYIGINARYVPNIWVRRAIMATLDPSYCVNYYGGGENASVIRRPMSKTLREYYDEQAFSDCSDYHYYPYGTVDGNDEGMTAEQKKQGAKDIAQRYVLEEGNCELRNGVLYDKTYGQSLKYTFTIAGNTEDHPAYNMLVNSQEILNSIGFDITLKQDSRALSLLAAGELTVWAAAWSSSSDPDMYQVYHKDSKATSINAWGYSFLNSNRSTDYERTLLTKLSDKIDEAREYNTPEERKPLYIEAQNMLMQLAIEFPTYQRKVYYVWRRGVFDESTMFTGAQVDTYQSPLSKIWKVSFNEG